MSDRNSDEEMLELTRQMAKDAVATNGELGSIDEGSGVLDLTPEHEVTDPVDQHESAPVVEVVAAHRPVSEVPLARVSDSLPPARASEPPMNDIPDGQMAVDGEDEPYELQVSHVVEEGAEPVTNEDAPVDHAFDFGTPGMVFDQEAPSEETAGVEVEGAYDVAYATAAEESEWVRESYVPDQDELTDGQLETSAYHEETRELDDGDLETESMTIDEEIEVADLEEVAEVVENESMPGMPAAPVPAPVSDAGSGPVAPPKGRPLASFFKDDKLAAAQASLKLRARTERARGKQAWWASIFDDEYLMLLPDISASEQQKQIEFIQRTLGLPQGALLLDLACGAGRNAIGMAKLNYRIVGVDLSLSMLARAGDAAQEAGQKINFIHGDMRDLGFDKTFDGVFCMDTSFGYFDEAVNMKVLRGVYDALKPGGVFLLELANRDFVIRQQPNMVWFQMDNMVCMEETDFNYINNRLYISRQLIIGDNERQSRHEFSLRLYTLNEIGQMLHQAGFAVLKVSGHRATPGAFFGPESAKMILVAERRGS